MNASAYAMPIYIHSNGFLKFKYTLPIDFIFPCQFLMISLNFKPNPWSIFFPMITIRVRIYPLSFILCNDGKKNSHSVMLFRDIYRFGAFTNDHNFHSVNTSKKKKNSQRKQLKLFLLIHKWEKRESSLRILTFISKWMLLSPVYASTKWSKVH